MLKLNQASLESHLAANKSVSNLQKLVTSAGFFALF